MASLYRLCVRKFSKSTFAVLPHPCPAPSLKVFHESQRIVDGRMSVAGGHSVANPE
jgi:hypothetical protein